MTTANYTDRVARAAPQADAAAALLALEQAVGPDADGIEALRTNDALRTARRGRRGPLSVLAVLFLGTGIVVALLVAWAHLPTLALWQPTPETVAVNTSHLQNEISDLRRALVETEAARRRLAEERRALIEELHTAKQQPLYSPPWYADVNALTYRDPFGQARNRR